MRRWMAAPLVLAPAVWLSTLGMPSAVAQPPEPSKETFKTPDGMELHGLFHATQKNPATAPVVVFLYAPGPDRDMTKGDWGTLAKKLTEEGYHVFQFDWRGHGKSTAIKDRDKFWKNQYLNGGNSNFNAYIKGGPAAGGPLKNDLSVKDVTNQARFLPAYLNDLAGVRLYLDQKNDNKELNSSSIYLVGTGDAAGLGLAWMASEWKRPAVFPGVSLLGLNVSGYEYVPQRLTGAFDEAGADFGGAVWLTATRPTSMPAVTIQKWASDKNIAAKMRDNTPMLFLFGEKDRDGKRASEFFFREVLVADPALAKRQNLEVPEQTFIRDVKGGEQLQGIKLLGNNAALKTEDTIIQYFTALQKVRQKLPSKTRDFKSAYYIDVRYFGLAP